MNTSSAANARPVMYMDVDGVLNFFGSRSGYRKRGDTMGYLHRTTVFVPEGGFVFNWSGEAVRKMAAMDADWMWLTTWMNHRATLDDTFGVNSVGSLMWKTDAGASHSGKFDALVADQNVNPRPFVWVDDVATVFFDASRVPAGVPYLLVKPDENFGVTAGDVARVAAFVADPYGFSTNNGY